MNQLLSKKPLIIAGPCSAETEEQVIDTAKQLAALKKIDVFRAGIWKPRTRPGNFEGIGTKGLSWLVKARQETGLLLATEVANTKQVEDALHFEIDILWIGARTTVSPFNVQEIAEALKGINIPIFIKNPVNPDLELWLGAYERLEKMNIKNLGFIHRGFSSVSNHLYRNSPMWHLAIDVKRKLPNIPMLVDPSHICGSRENLEEVSQKACDLNYDGIIIESHRDPTNAWSDAKQQVTPEHLLTILDKLIWKTEKFDSTELSDKLSHHRQQIDQIDNELLMLIAKRMTIAQEIGKYKNKQNVTILQQKRWNEIVQRLQDYGKKLGLSHEFIEVYLQAIHLESIRFQES